MLWAIGLAGSKRSCHPGRCADSLSWRQCRCLRGARGSLVFGKGSGIVAASRGPALTKASVPSAPEREAAYARASRSNIIPCENCRAFARLTLINDYPFTKGFMEATYECSVCGSVMKRATQAKDRVGNDQVPVGYKPCTKLPGGNVASRGDNLLRRAGDRIATMALTARYLRVCLADRSIKSLF